MNPSIWTEFVKCGQLSIGSVEPFITADTKVFAMGSCFAMEIYNALKNKGYQVFPRYSTVQASNQQIFDKINAGREFIAHYDVFVMHQEVRAALGKWTSSARRRGFYKVTEQPVNKMLRQEIVWQDPFRKLCYASSEDSLQELSERVTSVIREGLIEADVLIFTLGLIENWRSVKTGDFFCRPPGTGYGGGIGEANFHLAEFDDTFAELDSMISLIKQTLPKKRIVISVSPVPLEMTYRRDTDVYTANMESKSTLRAVAGKVVRQHPEVIYFPAYEMAQLMPVDFVYQPDRRHPRPEFAEAVISSFISCVSKS
jgi:hypothetical protein